MLFKPELAEKILAGEKTQTRRLVKPEHYLATSPDGVPAVWEDKKPTLAVAKYYVGQEMAICPGRGKFQVGRLKITALRQEHIYEITEDDARREGFSSSQEFLTVFRKLNPKAKITDNVWVIDFEVVRETIAAT